MTELAGAGAVAPGEKDSTTPVDVPPRPEGTVVLVAPFPTAQVVKKEGINHEARSAI